MTSREIRLPEQQRSKLRKVLPPFRVGVRSITCAERMSDFLSTQQFGKLRSPRECWILAATADPESLELGICRFGVPKDLGETRLEVSRSRGTEHCQGAEQVEMSKS